MLRGTLTEVSGAVNVGSVRTVRLSKREPT